MSTRTADTQPAAGWIALVGAGPGAVDLLTLRAVRFLQRADLVLYDALVHKDVLEFAPAHARRVLVGKRAGTVSWKQTHITELLIASAQAGENVVRLKGGDPFVFGRGGEEALAAVSLGLEVHVVPGISSAIAAPASAGIPVTCRGLASHFSVVTGHAADDHGQLEEQWTQLARAGGTLVFLMPKQNLHRIRRALRAGGVRPDTPAALIFNATRSSETVLRGTLETLADLADLADETGQQGPAAMVVGQVVSLSYLLAATQPSSDGRPSATTGH